LDASVVYVALPHIGKEFGVSLGALQWVLTGYLLALASLVLVGGALGDRYGRRRIFVIGTGWFAVASFLCGLAPNAQMLVGARILEGVGAALLTPGSLAIVQSTFAEPDRARAVGAWSALGGVAGAAGPAVGGWLVDNPGWRWAFFINPPIAVLAVACALFAVPETRNSHAARSVDLTGAGFVAISLATATWALTGAGSRGWTDRGVLTGSVIAVLTMVVFVRHVRHVHSPLVPPALFRNRQFTVTNLTTIPMYAAIGVTLFAVAFELQVAAGWSALGAGMALTPATIVLLLFSEESGALAQRIGPRPFLTAGPILAAIGLLILSRIGQHTSWLSDVLPGALVFGLGLAIFVAPLTATVMGSVGSEDVSIASGLNNAIARTASLLALAVVPVVARLSTASGKVAVTHSFRLCVIMTAAIAASAGPLSFVGLGAHARMRRSARRKHCSIDAPPVQPDPRKVESRHA
jgi:EmrB/QacA subfamily drug resistance transporter